MKKYIQFILTEEPNYISLSGVFPINVFILIAPEIDPQAYAYREHDGKKFPWRIFTNNGRDCIYTNLNKVKKYCSKTYIPKSDIKLIEDAKHKEKFSEEMRHDFRPKLTWSQYNKKLTEFGNKFDH
jgi:hypothetical protein